MDCKRVLLELKNKEGNDVCIDCGAEDPQWANINFGIFLCSKCFDLHRSLNENSVRSLTMDTWTKDQVQRMKVGGNLKAEKYFKSKPEYRKDMSIQEKYNSTFAKTYKRRLTDACHKQKEKELKKLAKEQSSSPSSNSTSPTIDESINNNANVIDNNKSNETKANTDSNNKNSNNNSPSDNNNWENIYLFNSDPTNILDPNLKEYDNITLLRVYRPNKEKNEEFFAKKGRENNMRREDIPPSQGGKYTGFGSKPLRTEEELQNEGLAHFQKSLSTGWNFLTSTVNSLNQNIIKPASNAVRDPRFSQNIENYAENIKRSLAEKAYVAKDQLNNAKDQINTVVQNFQKSSTTASNTNNDNNNRDDLILNSMESDSNNEVSKSGQEPFIVVDYDYIENSDNDIFSYPKSDNKFLNNMNESNGNDFCNRRNSTNSFSSINESLSRAYSIGGSSASLISTKINRSRSSLSSLCAKLV